MNGEARRWHWAALPSVAIFLGLFIAPFATFFAMSFWRVQMFKLIPAFTFDNYVTVFHEYGENIAFTVGIALAIGSTATAIGFSFAYALRFAFGRWANPILFLVMVSIVGGYLIKIYAWKSILGTYGVINSLLLWAGLISEPLSIFIYNPVAVLIALIHYLFPLAILPIYAALRNIKDATLESARDLGAGPWRVFRDVVLPQTQQGIIASMTFCFILSAGDFVTPALVGGTSTTMIGSFIYGQFVESFNWPLGSAIAFSTLATSAIMVAVLSAVVSLLRPRW